MTTEQISALAREYAEECAEEVGVMFNPQDWACSHCEIEARAVIKFLLRRYCLVEKSKVAIKYKNMKRLEEDATAFGFENIRGNAIIIKGFIKSLFPDLTWESDPLEVELIIKRKKNGKQ